MKSDSVVDESTAASCPLGCQSELRQHFSVYKHSRHSKIMQCTDCNFVFATPRPTPEELDKFYRWEYFDAGTTNQGYINYRADAEVNARLMWSVLRSSYQIDDVHPRSLLDVGCATGAFLAAAKEDGWKVTGLELSEECANVAREEFSLEIHCSDLTKHQLHGQQFGLITLWQVIEHLIDPGAAIAAARELLTQEGFLFLELPNWNSLGRIIRRSKWSQLVPPEHINYFQTDTISALLKANGFEVLKISTHYPSITNLARKRTIWQPFWACLGFAALMASRLGAGGYIRVLAKKR